MQIETVPAPAEKVEARDREAFKKLLADPLTRRVARQVIRFSEKDQTGPTEGRDAMAVATGKRAVGNYLVERMRALDPDGWILFEREYLDELHELDALQRGQVQPPGDTNQGGMP